MIISPKEWSRLMLNTDEVIGFTRRAASLMFGQLITNKRTLVFYFICDRFQWINLDGMPKFSDWSVMLAYKKCVCCLKLAKQRYPLVLMVCHVFKCLFKCALVFSSCQSVFFFPNESKFCVCILPLFCLGLLVSYNC